jgi:hypothetical protein
LATVNAAGTLSASERPAAGLWLPGTGSNYAAIPAASVSIATSITLEVLLDRQNALGGGSYCTPVSYKDGSGRGYLLYIKRDANQARLFWNDGTGDRDSGDVTIPALANKTWLRVHVVLATGVITFETSDDGTAWALEATVTRASGVGFSTNAARFLAVGAINYSLATNNFEGVIYRARVLHDGTLVADFDSTSPPSRHGVHPSSFTDSVGNVWTINGSDWEYRDDLGRTLATASEAAGSTPGVAGGLATLDAEEVAGGVHPLLSGAVGGGAIAFYVSDGELSSFTPGEALAFGTPFYLGHDATLVRASVEVLVAGAAGSVVRLGVGRLRRKADNAIEAFDVADLGVVDGTTTGVKTLTTSEMLTAGWHFLISAVQGGAATRPSLRSITGAGRRNSVLYIRAAEGYGVAPVGMAAGGVSGALPATLGLPSAANSSPAVFVSFA